MDKKMSTTHNHKNQQVVKLVTWVYISRLIQYFTYLLILLPSNFYYKIQLSLSLFHKGKIKNVFKNF